MEITNSRAVVLLRATYDLLKQMDDSPIVLDIGDVTIHYDGADCDGSCLMYDIEHELGIDGDSQ